MGGREGPEIAGYPRGTRVSERYIERGRANFCWREGRTDGWSENCRYRAMKEDELKTIREPIFS